MYTYDSVYDYIITDLIDHIREHNENIRIEKDKIFFNYEYPIWINFHRNGNILTKVVIEFPDKDSTYEFDNSNLIFREFDNLFEDIYGIMRSIDELLQMDDEERARYLYDRAERLNKRLDPQYEEMIKASPFYTYFYARNIIEDRWLEGEPHIMKDNEVLLDYLIFLKRINKLPKFKVIFE